MSNLQQIIEEAFENRAEITPRSVDTHVKEAVLEAMAMLDKGELRVAEQRGVGDWQVNEWLKKGEVRVRGAQCARVVSTQRCVLMLNGGEVRSAPGATY